MSAYYNENDPFVAQWLRNLIAAGHIASGDVDERSIIDVRDDDLRGYEQCHFFAGIGGWSYALRLAGWPDNRPVWTGSCPCQPFSTAARGRQARGQDIERHLWPDWRRLILQRAPLTVFGEQIAQAGDWFDQVCNDLEKMGYTIGAAILPALCVGQDHIRSRIYFAGHTNGKGKSVGPVNVEMARMPWNKDKPGSMVLENGLPTDMAQLRAFGNALVPQLAAIFIMAAVECLP